MRALTYQSYGKPSKIFSIAELEKPNIGPNELLIKVMASTVNRTDEGLVTARYVISRLFTGLWKPKNPVPGTDFSGKVEAVGEQVSHYKIGDELFGFNDEILSSQAEFMVLKNLKYAIRKPKNISHTIAAASCEGAHYALNCLNKINLEAGANVLVNGGTGAIGSAAIQILKSRGMVITATANSENIERVTALGAVKVIDYTREDFTKLNQQFELVLDAVGKSQFTKCRKILKPKGIYISTELGKRGINLFWALTTPLFGGKKVIFPVPSKIDRSLSFIKELLEKGNFRPLIDREYAFEDIIEAYEYVGKGQKIGNVVINMDREVT